MKKIALALAAVLSMSIAVPAYAGIGVTIDGNSVKFTASSGSPTVDENSRTLVPLRAAMEAYGCKVSWDEPSKTATVSKNDGIVQVPVGENRIIVNGAKINTDTKAKIIDGRVYLPIRAVLEAFGASVGWDQTSQCVTVTSPSTDQAFPSWDVLRKSIKIANNYVIGGISYDVRSGQAASYATVPASGDTTWIDFYRPDSSMPAMDRYIQLCTGEYSFNDNGQIVLDKGADKCVGSVSGADVTFTYGNKHLTFINGSAVGNHTSKGVRMITYRLDDEFGCCINATDLAKYFGIDKTATYNLNSRELIIK